MKIYTDILQNSEAWENLRKGRPTASRFSEIITAAKGELSKSASSYIRELIGECYVPEFKYWEGNAFTERGTEFEAEGRAAFAAYSGLDVKQVGFVLSDDKISGCSPDGLIMDAKGEYFSGLELKCPTPKVHVGYVMDGVLPDAYKQQVHGSMVITGLNEWNFWSYFPGLNPLHIVVKRDDYTAKVEKALAEFVVLYLDETFTAQRKLQMTTKLMVA